MRVTQLAWIAASVCLTVWGQLPGLRDANEVGLAAGASAVEFSLLDQTGQRRTLESLMGPQGLVLVFVRSADW